MRVIEGKLVGTGLRIAITASRFNELVVNKLIEGAKDILLRHDVSHNNIDIYSLQKSFPNRTYLL